MKQKKTNQTQTTRNTYQYMTTPGSADIDALRQNISRLGNIDPSIQYEAGLAKQNIENRFNNPFGANYSPEVQDAIRYNQGQQIDQRAGVMVRDDRRRAQLAQISAQGGLAQLTAPQLVQSGGTMQGTMTQSAPGPWGAIAGGALSGAGSAVA